MILLLTHKVSVFQYFYRPESPLTSDFCIESAIQLSLDFFCATPACECQSPGSNDHECEVYGGQCACIEAEVEQGFSAIHGRQCDLCPFYSYLTPGGCTRKLHVAVHPYQGVLNS